MLTSLFQNLISNSIKYRSRETHVAHPFDILTKVLHHLIRNAIEYCGRPEPRVHVSSERRDMEWAISVRDNGPVMDLAFQDRIVGAFQRLHGREFPGNGLGLAFCKEAIAGLLQVAAESPDANHQFECRGPLPNLFAQGPRRGKCVRWQGRDIHDIVWSGCGGGQHLVG
jgi:light-regulated signal transduction histidine kinase (bacteriophytochrome)